MNQKSHPSPTLSPSKKYSKALEKFVRFRDTLLNNEDSASNTESIRSAFVKLESSIKVKFASNVNSLTDNLSKVNDSLFVLNRQVETNIMKEKDEIATFLESIAQQAQGRTETISTNKQAQMGLTFMDYFTLFVFAICAFIFLGFSSNSLSYLYQIPLYIGFVTAMLFSGCGFYKLYSK